MPNNSPSLSKSEMAVAVALDIIKQLTLTEHPLVAAHKGYISSPLLISQDQVALDLQDLVSDIQAAGCEVCMRGAAVLSKARLYDNVPMAECCEYEYNEDATSYRVPHLDRVQTEKYLEEVFDDDTRHLMEVAFECDPSIDFYTPCTAESFGAAIFGMKYEKAKDRMIAIAENIANNGGVFVVEEGTRENYRRTFESFTGEAMDSLGDVEDPDYADFDYDDDLDYDFDDDDEDEDDDEED